MGSNLYPAKNPSINFVCLSVEIEKEGNSVNRGDDPNFDSTHAFYIHTHAIQTRLVAFCFN